MSAPKPTILLVEDDASLRTALKDQLVKLGCKVDVAENGQEAMTVMSTKKYTCVISDIRMPNVDGISLLDSMRLQGISTPIIMMTGHSEYTEVEIVKRGGAVLLEKPFDRTRLKELVQDYIMLLPLAG